MIRTAILLLAAITLSATSVLAGVVDFSSSFSGNGPTWDWTNGSGGTGTGAMTIDTAGSAVKYAQLLTPAGGIDTDVVLEYSFDLDISNLTKLGGAGSFISLFTIGANGNQGPAVNGLDGSRTEIRLENFNSQGDWRVNVASGGIFGGTQRGFGAVLNGANQIGELQEANLHFAGTLTLTETAVNNSLIVTSFGNELWNITTDEALGAPFGNVGANFIDSYSLGALQFQNSFSGDLVFDNFEIAAVTAVPEPSSLALIVLGVIGAGIHRRRVRSRMGRSII